MFFLFSNRLGCVSSLEISALVSIMLLVTLGLVQLWRFSQMSSEC
jgi:hypothetical protein